MFVRCNATTERPKGENITMLIYTTILIASLIVAVLARLFFTEASNKSLSLYGSNEGIAISTGARAYKSRKAYHQTRSSALVPSGEDFRVTAWNQEKTHPVTPIVRCNRDTSWLLREKKLVSVGNTYKVKRRVEPTAPTLDLVSKPFRRKPAPWAHDNKLAIRPWKE